MEQNFAVRYHRYALREGSGGAGKHRGGLGLDYEVELRRGSARASFVMDHGRFGPQGALGGADGAAHVLKCILAEADLMMAVNGYPSLSSVRSEGAHRVPFNG